MKVIIFILIIVLIQTQQRKINYLELQSINQLSLTQLIESFSQRQGQIYRKIFNHYIDNQIRQWKAQNQSQEDIRKFVANLITKQNTNLFTNMKKFVENQLFYKLEMNNLVESLQKDIRQNPENYYLTFEVYDLLID